MPTLEPEAAALHKKFYLQFWDELDTDTISAIMKDPDGEEAQLLNQRVMTEVRRQLGY